MPRSDPQAIEDPGVCVFRYEGPLMFASFPYFKHKLIEKTSVDPVERRKLLKAVPWNTHCNTITNSSFANDTTRLTNEQKGEEKRSQCEQELNVHVKLPEHVKLRSSLLVNHIILDCSVWSFIDDTALTLLIEVLNNLLPH